MLIGLFESFPYNLFTERISVCAICCLTLRTQVAHRLQLNASTSEVPFYAFHLLVVWEENVVVVQNLRCHDNACPLAGCTVIAPYFYVLLHPSPEAGPPLLSAP